MKGGVLIIGSLNWDIHQKKDDNVRQDWKANHLRYDDKIKVAAPIRYGRISGRGVYTMVFSKSLEENAMLGTAYVAPFNNEIENFEALDTQAGNLSYAEGTDDRKLVKGNDEVWCVIGILFNPRFNLSQKELLLNKFQQKLEAENLNDVYTQFHLPCESSVLSPQGEMLIRWPQTSNIAEQVILDELDFVIATCPKPNLPAYPDAVTIKKAADTDKRKYFYNNREHGITTYQDDEIMRANEKG
jgi:hypothetical protein